MAIYTQNKAKNSIQRKVNDDKIRKQLGLTDFCVSEDLCDDSFYEMGEAIYLKDFGAKGDGIKNDFSAIKKALTVLKHSPRGTILVFEPNTTYYISSGKIAVELKELKGVKIYGNNTTILVKPIMSFLKIENCSDIVIKGINFDYKIKPYAVADVVHTGEDGAIRIKTDKSLNIRGTYNQPNIDYFGLVDKKDGRYPVGITSYKVVNPGECVYDVKCNNTFAERDTRIKMMKEEKYKFIVPMPHVGQVIEQAIAITNNKNITMVDCEVRCAAEFMFFVSGNDGFVYFKNLNIGSGEEKEDSSIIGWRDGFYCKDNRAKILWENCNIKSLYDDILNMTSSQLQVRQLGDNRVSLYLQESELQYVDIKVGDEITFVDSEVSTVIGKRTIKSVEKFDSYIKIEIDSALKKLSGLSAVSAFINNISLVNSVIKNCDFGGNFKLHTPLYVKQSDFLIKNIDTEQQVLPKNTPVQHILFSNCRLDFDLANNAIADVELSKEIGFCDCEINVLS